MNYVEAGDRMSIRGKGKRRRFSFSQSINTAVDPVEDSAPAARMRGLAGIG